MLLPSSLCVSLQHTKAQEDHRDMQEKGLELRVTRAGLKSWAFRYRRSSDRKKRLITLGHFPDFDLGEARRWAQDIRREVSRGGDPASGVQERKAAPTFRELVGEWESCHAELNRSRQVRADDRSILKLYAFPAIGDMKVHNIGRREISAMLAGARKAIDCRRGHRKNGKDPRRLTQRANSVFALVRAIMRWALAQGIITIDPTHGMTKPIKKEVVRDRELSPAEIKMFWCNLDKLPSTPGLRIAMKLSLTTAQRIGDVCGICKSELVLDGPGPVWILPGERSKNGEGLRVPLSPLAVRLIGEAFALQKRKDGEEESPWLFPARAKRDGSHGPIQGHAATVAMFRGRGQLGTAHFRIHDLRRTAATRMAEMGINPFTISLVLNHVSASKSTITGKVYVLYSFDREKREALDAWSALLERIIAGKDSIAVGRLAAHSGDVGDEARHKAEGCVVVRAINFARALTSSHAAHCVHDEWSSPATTS
jgi:integrase